LRSADTSVRARPATDSGRKACDAIRRQRFHLALAAAQHRGQHPSCRLRRRRGVAGLLRFLGALASLLHVLRPLLELAAAAVPVEAAAIARDAAQAAEPAHAHEARARGEPPDHRGQDPAHDDRDTTVTAVYPLPFPAALTVRQAEVDR
jgi:hypothetical protein